MILQYMGRKKKEETSENKIDKPKSISPFDIIKMMFMNDGEFEKLSNIILSKNYFMINRILAIQFPIQAQFFNKLNIDTANVIRSWRTFVVMKYGYGRVPGFVYTKGAKKSETITNSISKELKEDYCRHYKITMKELDDMLYFGYDYTVNELNNFDKNVRNIKDNAIEKIK